MLIVNPAYKRVLSLRAFCPPEIGGLWYIIYIIYMFYPLRDWTFFGTLSTQRLDSLSRAPVFSHFSDTLTGLVTIRSFRWRLWWWWWIIRWWWWCWWRWWWRCPSLTSCHGQSAAKVHQRPLWEDWHKHIRLPSSSGTTTSFAHRRWIDSKSFHF